ncbi:hypothetical protein ACJJIK_02115 [Microbulbifer sp. ZKSA006]|uniref:hypothetical protein n=1 Tax=Microbulbifer sp. ZKSA006 TaxID=3243390 RepID=UPI0040394B08
MSDLYILCIFDLQLISSERFFMPILFYQSLCSNGGSVDFNSSGEKMVSRGKGNTLSKAIEYVKKHNLKVGGGGGDNDSEASFSSDVSAFDEGLQVETRLVDVFVGLINDALKRMIGHSKRIYKKEPDIICLGEIPCVLADKFISGDILNSYEVADNLCTPKESRHAFLILHKKGFKLTVTRPTKNIKADTHASCVVVQAEESKSQSDKFKTTISFVHVPNELAREKKKTKPFYTKKHKIDTEQVHPDLVIGDTNQPQSDCTHTWLTGKSGGTPITYAPCVRDTGSKVLGESGNEATGKTNCNREKPYDVGVYQISTCKAELNYVTYLAKYKSKRRMERKKADEGVKIMKCAVFTDHLGMLVNLVPKNGDVKVPYLEPKQSSEGISSRVTCMADDCNGADSSVEELVLEPFNAMPNGKRRHPSSSSCSSSNARPDNKRRRRGNNARPHISDSDDSDSDYN